MPQATEFIHEVNDSDDQGVFFFLRKGTRGTDRPTRSEKPKIKKKKKKTRRVEPRGVVYHALTRVHAWKRHVVLQNNRVEKQGAKA